MANGADADNLAADFKRGNESGAFEGDDQFALPVVHGASGLATRLRRERQQSKCAVDGVSEAPHGVEIRRRAGGQVEVFMSAMSCERDAWTSQQSPRHGA
jgi:hypothetical protein